MLTFRQDGEGITLEGVAAHTRVLILTGEPIGEPVTQYGPFVMNTQTEIMEAMRDYQMGKMGVYIDD
jgi:redox-sensitive bicupin YhaK (pirin superfamily)